MQHHRFLLYGALGSVGLLLVFLVFQGMNASLLQLPSQWLWVSLVPVVVSLVAGGYIEKFKASGIEFEGGKKVRVKPTKPPTDKRELPSIDDKEQLPADYLFLNHTSFLREKMQEEFQRRTGVKLPHYDIRVIVDSYYHGALDQIERVEYVLHEAYPNPIQVRTRREDRFLLKEVANGEYVLLAKIYMHGRKQMLVLQRYITLWKEGPRLESKA